MLLITLLMSLLIIHEFLQLSITVAPFHGDLPEKQFLYRILKVTDNAYLLDIGTFFYLKSHLRANTLKGACLKCVTGNQLP